MIPFQAADRRDLGLKWGYCSHVLREAGATHAVLQREPTQGGWLDTPLSWCRGTGGFLTHRRPWEETVHLIEMLFSLQ